MTDRYRQPRPAVPARVEKGGGLPAAVLALCLSGAVAGIAQTPTAPQEKLVPPPAWALNDLMCSPSLATAPPTTTLRVLGSQDTVVKTMFGPGDALVISGGAAGGLQAGQEYYVRRLVHQFGAKSPDREHPVGVHTVAWVRILAVESRVATAIILHACDGILLDDYLEPYSPPLVAARTPAGGAAPSEQTGQILTGDETRILAGIGQFMSIDRGSDHGVAPGQRFRVFRDKRRARLDSDGRSATFRQSGNDLPMVEIAEVVVVSVRPETSTVQVVVGRDAVQAGDFITGTR